MDTMQPGSTLGGGGTTVKKERRSIITPEFRVSFPCVLRRGKPMKPGQDAKFSLVMLFPKGANLQNLMADVARAITEEYGADKTAWPKLKNPFRDQGEKSFEGYEPGAIFVTATAKNQPGLVDENVDRIIDESRFYAGCWAIAEVNAFCYDSNGVKGVSFGLNNVQKVRDGKPLAGNKAPEDVFSPITPAAGAEAGHKPMSMSDLFD